MTDTNNKQVVIIGAGAAGTMAAIFAARAGADVTLLERTKDGGRKILISGGGRCNVLPSRVDEARFVTASSPNILRKIIRSWPLHSRSTSSSTIWVFRWNTKQSRSSSFRRPTRHATFVTACCRAPSAKGWRA